MSEQVELELVFIKSTPGTHVYGTDDRQATCRQVYLQKDSQLFQDGKPDTIVMVLRAK